MSARADIRPPAVAGMFYERSPQLLRASVKKMLEEASAAAPPGGEPHRGRVVAIISPHAGHVYSGTVAAAGYRLLKNADIETVVIVSPSHREYFDGVSVFAGSAYETPLGEVQVDAELRQQLVDDVIEASYRGHGAEHAIEVQLPFLQAVLSRSFRILPIVMGDQHRRLCMHLGSRLGTVLRGRQALMVASTDLSHYYPSEVADRLDQIAIDDVAALDEEKLMADLAGERTEACGGGPTVAVLHAAKLLGADRASILAHRNSGDVSGDRDRVVGYLSAAITSGR